MTETPPILERARALTEPALVAAVDRLSPDLALPVRYHFGWVDETGAAVEGGGGKGVRPALAVLSAEAAGADPAIALPGAVAVELVHNFSLLHDDIIDGDTERRHRPTVWALHGVADAIIAGDALQTLAFEVLLADPVPTRVAACRRLADATAAMIRGQRADMAFDDRLEVTVAECVAMEGDKTGALLAYSAAVGAELAGAPDNTVDALAAYGLALGLAFQAVDDVLGIWGDPSVTGKAAGNDLRERKKSVPVVHALAAGGSIAAELRRLFERTEMDDDAVARATALIDEAGGRRSTEDAARDHLDAALAALAGANIDAGAAAELAALAIFIVERKH